LIDNAKQLEKGISEQSAKLNEIENRRAEAAAELNLRLRIAESKEIVLAISNLCCKLYDGEKSEWSRVSEPKEICEAYVLKYEQELAEVMMTAEEQEEQTMHISEEYDAADATRLSWLEQLEGLQQKAASILKALKKSREP